MRTARVFAAALVPLLGPIATPAASAAQSAIGGVVLDALTSKPVVGATVIVLADGNASVTQAEGRFRLLVAGAGRFIVETRHVAYATRADTIVLLDGHNALVEIRLVEAAIELPPITVETRSRRLDDAGFFGRRERGIGTFFTRKEVDEYNVRQLSDLFSRVPGLRRTLYSDGSSRIDSRGGRQLISSRCEIQYFLDGVRSELGMSGVDIIPVEVIEGIEVYRGGSEVPTQFTHGSSMCGAVLIWTRRG